METRFIRTTSTRYDVLNLCGEKCSASFVELKSNKSLCLQLLFENGYIVRTSQIEGIANVDDGVCVMTKHTKYVMEGSFAELAKEIKKLG